jgi:hypothetical protein
MIAAVRIFSSLAHGSPPCRLAGELGVDSCGRRLGQVTACLADLAGEPDPDLQVANSPPQARETVPQIDGVDDQVRRLERRGSPEQSVLLGDVLVDPRGAI